MSGKKTLVTAAWFIFFINWFSFNSCTDDNLADLMKTDDTTSGESCDTSFIVSYKFDIAPIIKSKCPLCHTAAYYTFDGGDIRLDTWDFLKIKADEGKLLCAINQTLEDECLPMPRITSDDSNPGPKIELCYIMRITAWVQQGAKNN